MNRAKICVIGAGVIGLSSALHVLDRYPGVDLTVIAEKFSPQTTSDGSAGYWEPYLCGDTPAELINKWGKSTYDYLNSVMMSDEAYEAGVETLMGYNFYPRYVPDPSWRDIPLEFRHITQREIDLYAPHAKHGFFFSSLTCACVHYLPWLEKRIRKKGGRFKKKRIEHLSELAGNFDVIINCTGLGSFRLVDDKEMSPIQGQVLRVKNTTARTFFFDFEDDCESASSYVIPWRDIVVLGGTAVKGEWSEKPSVETTNAIMKKCCQFVPSLKDTTILQEWTGLRPWRSKGVRLERELMRFGTSSVHVVHNYGHSGGGVTLHWGCAQDTAELVGQCLKELPYSKL